MRLAPLAVVSLLVSGGALASQDIKIVGNIKQTIKAPQARTLKAQPPKVITLLKVNVSEKARQTLVKRTAETSKLAQHVPIPSYARHAQLGMNGVPVLNQGSHGTCATFANTAAIDAALGKGDYISQLCQLQLGRHLENSAYMPSGWEGTTGQIVLNQMTIFGVVTKDQQRTNGCAGLNEYPMEGADPAAEMTLPEYHQISEAIPQDKVAWSSILDVYQASLERTNIIRAINNIKAALQAGDRVTFGVLLVDFNVGVVGAIGQNVVANDTWILTPEMAHDLQEGAELAGHEMVITGYDDDAVATDDHGRLHRGLFTLRNSWGEGIGDKGNFYMSYNYLNALIIEAQRIRVLKSDDVDGPEDIRS